MRVAAVLLSLAVAAAGEELKAPSVTVQAVHRRQGGIETGDPAKAKVPMTLIVVNNSPRELTKLSFAVDPGPGFTASATPRFPSALAPFGTFVGAFELVPPPRLAYGKHDVVVTVRYQWSDTKTTYTSAQPVTVSVELKRLFDEEAKGLPGGTAALFYLLLPVLPALFAYQLVDRARRGDGLRVPVFDKDYVLPAFAVGLAVNYFLGAQYSRTKVLLYAAVIGAAWPALHWGWEAYRRWRWGFKTTDDCPTYLQKALLSYRPYHGDLWVTAKAGNEIWSGALLQQPDGKPVLGARLTITPVYPDKESEDDKKKRFDRLKAIANVTDGPSTRAQRKAICDEVKEGRATLEVVEQVDRGEGKHPKIIAAEELMGFERQKAERKLFVQPRP